MVTSQQREANSLVTVSQDGTVKVESLMRVEVRNAVVSFLDAATTATGQSTYYNPKADQDKAAKAAHEAVFTVNRGLYAAMLTLPGVTDYSRQRGLYTLLSNNDGREDSLLSPEQEDRAIDYLIRDWPPHKRLNFYAALREERVNSRRTTKLIMRSCLNSQNLPYWAVKYRRKLAQAIRHALGLRRAAWLRHALSKPNKTVDDWNALSKTLDGYFDERATGVSKREVYEAVTFILGGELQGPIVNPLLRAYREAREDIAKGEGLPRETLEGLRSRFYDFRKNKSLPRGFDKGDRDGVVVSPAQILEMSLAAGTMTERQKINAARSAADRGVNVGFDPSKQDLVNLYVYAMVKLYMYAMEVGMTADIREGMNRKAKKIARELPLGFRFGRVGIVVDNSESMKGGGQSKNRPMAIALAMRDVISACARESFVFATNGEFDEMGTAKLGGSTSLAEGLISAIEAGAEVVFLITDGYENAPAGRVDEVIRRLREIGIETPVHQITPVMAAESMGRVGATRQLSDKVAVMPVTKPEDVGLSLVRAALASDVESGIRQLIEASIRLVESK